MEGKGKVIFGGCKSLPNKRIGCLRRRAQVEVWIAYGGEIIEHEITEMEVAP